MSKTKKKKSGKTRVLILVLILLALATGAAVVYQVLSSQPRKDAIVVELDAGFGGDQTGDTGFINESEFNQNVVMELEKLLKKDNNFIVVLSHPYDTAASVDQKAEKVNQEMPDIVLSIHASGSVNPEEAGMHIYVDAPTSSYHAKSLALGQALQKEFTSQGFDAFLGYYYYKEIKSGVYQAHLVESTDTTDYAEETLRMMMSSKVPVVQVEQIYVTNAQEVEQWANEEGYKTAASYYYEALKNYYGVK